MASGKEAQPAGRSEPPTPDIPEGLAAAAPEENGPTKRYGTKAADATTQFALRNPLLAAFIPDVLENAVDAILPDSFEAKMEGSAQRMARRYEHMATDFNLGYGEVAAALLRICKYALARFKVGDIVFGVYHLAQHHIAENTEDAIEGRLITSPVMIKWIMYCANLAMASYCPTREEFARVAGCKTEDITDMDPTTSSARPAWAMGVDHKARQVILAFRGTSDLNDAMTDAAASAVPYCGGYAHLGMLKAARWFVKNKLHKVRDLCDANPGYGVLLVGHSLGAGTAVLLGHLIRQGDPEAMELMKGIKLHAVGIATPAVLTAELAEGCSSYITSVVLQHDMVPRFSIYNVFCLKEEMDATRWQDRVAAIAHDWAVPDVIEHSETYKKMVRGTGYGLGVLVNALARFWLTLMQLLITAMQYIGLGRPAREALHAEQSEGEAGPSGVASLKDVAQSTAKAVSLVMHHPSLAPETVAAIERAVAEAASGDIHAVYAPGKLFFLKRNDPPKEERDALLKAAKEKKEAREALKKARAQAAARRAAAKEAGDESSTDDAPVQDAADSESDEEDPFPGATFTLICGSKGQRFKRMVLQETCLADHMCGGYCIAIQRLVEKHGEGKDQ